MAMIVETGFSFVHLWFRSKRPPNFNIRYMGRTRNPKKEDEKMTQALGRASHSLHMSNKTSTQVTTVPLETSDDMQSYLSTFGNRNARTQQRCSDDVSPGETPLRESDRNVDDHSCCQLMGCTLTGPLDQNHGSWAPGVLLAGSCTVQGKIKEGRESGTYIVKAQGAGPSVSTSPRSAP
ncbi:hypothetical protein LZ30DRAFT_90594 [Colletotrichum cereale]|nr:hypothetical protein LZ30DRAFT_90594 [Colletotrichum cereale]